jgi:hypothetical protein
VRATGSDVTMLLDYFSEGLLTSRSHFPHQATAHRGGGDQMRTGKLSETEVIVLEAVDALGGDVHISALKGAVRWQARRNAHKVLGLLTDCGLLNRYARGCYVLTEAGRAALASSLSEVRPPAFAARALPYRETPMQERDFAGSPQAGQATAG